jgi:hypothetical protein
MSLDDGNAAPAHASNEAAIRESSWKLFGRICGTLFEHYEKAPASQP